VSLIWCFNADLPTEYPLSKIHSWQRQDSLQKLLAVDLDQTIAVSVERSERLGQLHRNDTRTYEAVERDFRRGSLLTTRRWGRPFDVIFALH